MLTETISLSLIFLIGASALSGSSTALCLMGRLQGEEEIQERAPFFFVRGLLPFFFGKNRWEGLLFSMGCCKHILRLCFALSAFFILLDYPPFNSIILSASAKHSFNWYGILSAFVLIISVSLLFDYLATLIAQVKPALSFEIFSPIAAIFLFICSPVTVLLYKLLRPFAPSAEKSKLLSSNIRIRDRVSELLQDTQLGAYLDANEQKLILSVVSFKERIAREVMVPRIDIFSLPADTSLKDAAQSFLQEDYSRIPVYKENVDIIIGVLIYKDILKILASASSQKYLDTPIEQFVKPVLYTPETKKISQLLQEFRSKQIHLAIVVDEYGGTEGIVTIEDILEELVGEIADEYDVGEEELFTALPTGGWIVDAKMNIIDIENKLGVKIPSGAEYATIGGYIFHRAGSIPSKGWKIHHDEFDLEVLSSSERAVDKIRITPHSAP